MADLGDFTFEELSAAIDADPALRDWVQRFIITHPDLLVSAVKTVRSSAVDPATPLRERQEYQRLLKQLGYDDESLMKEDEEKL